jgi:hypothetical protein
MVGAAGSNQTPKVRTTSQAFAFNASTNTLTVSDLVVTNGLVVSGTTTNINTTNLVVEDKNIIIGDVDTPSDVTADGGGITLKGATDKTITWVDSTDRWTSNQVFSAPNYVSTVSTGTAPYAATSTTLNTNLNADLLDGQHAAAFVDLTSTQTITGTKTFTDLIVGDSSTSNWELDGNLSTAFYIKDSSSSTKFTVLSNGNVGVGTETPSEKLEVNGNVKVSGDFIIGDALSGWQIDADSLSIINIKDPNNNVRFSILDDGKVGIGTTSPTTILDIVGDLKHTGLVMTTGTNVDQTKSTTFTSALTTAWTDVTGVSGTYLATGSYIVQIESNGEYYTGNMSWFSGSTTSTVADEIELHRAGPAASAARVYARVIRVSTGTLKLQVSASASLSSHTMTFKFRRTI